MYGRFRRRVRDQFTFMLGNNGRAQVHSDIPLHRREPYEPPFVAVAGHPVADAFFCVRRNLPYGPAHFLQLGLHRFRRFRDVLIYIIWSFRHVRNGSIRSARIAIVLRFDFKADGSTASISSCLRQVRLT